MQDTTKWGGSPLPDGVSFGEITLASPTASIIIEHDLGIIPSKVKVIPKNDDVFVTNVYRNIAAINEIQMK